jgi:hypothetical protein
MAHDRETIRKAFVTALTGLTTTGARVYRTRVYPMDAAKLPGLIVYTTEEENEPPTMGTSAQERELTVVVEGYAKTSPTLIDDTLDDIADEVETAIGADRTLSGSCQTCWLSETSIEYVSGDQPAGVVKMQFTTFYRA